MYNPDYTKWASWNQTVTAPLFDIQRILMPFNERMSHENISFMTDKISAFVKYMQEMNKTNGTNDFARLQLNFMSGETERVLQYGQSVFKVMEDVVKDSSDWMSEKMDVAFKATENEAAKAA